MGADRFYAQRKFGGNFLGIFPLGDEAQQVILPVGKPIMRSFVGSRFKFISKPLG